MRSLLNKHYNKPNNLLENMFFTKAVLYHGHYVCPDYWACLENRQKRETFICFHDMFELNGVLYCLLYIPL